MRDTRVTEVGTNLILINRRLASRTIKNWTKYNNRVIDAANDQNLTTVNNVIESMQCTRP